jgi:hypothetical protein
VISHLWLLLRSIDWVRNAPVLQAVSTLVIGSGTLTVGALVWLVQRQQAITNRRQYRLALFEKRMKVFDSTMNLIAEVLRDARVELDQLFQLLRDIREHEFLFGPEIKDYIDEVYRRGVELHTRRAAGNPAELQRETDLLMWFSEQTAEARQKFLKYIDFREP